MSYILMTYCSIVYLFIYMRESLKKSYNLLLNVSTFSTISFTKWKVYLFRSKFRKAAVSYVGPLYGNSLSDSLEQSISTSVLTNKWRLVFYRNTLPVILYLLHECNLYNRCICDCYCLLSCLNFSAFAGNHWAMFFFHKDIVSYKLTFLVPC